MVFMLLWLKDAWTLESRGPVNASARQPVAVSNREMKRGFSLSSSSSSAHFFATASVGYCALFPLQNVAAAAGQMIRQ